MLLCSNLLRSTPYSLIASWQTGFELQTCCACSLKSLGTKFRRRGKASKWGLLADVSAWLYNISWTMIPTERVPITDNYRIFFAHTSNQSWCAMDRVEEYDKNGESNSGNLQEFESAPISIKIHSGENESRFAGLRWKGEKNLISVFDGFSTVPHLEISRLMDRNSRVK